MKGPQPVTGDRAPLTFFQSVKMVAWSFLGIRSGQGYRDDLTRANPLHVVALGFIGVLGLVGALIVLVNWVVSK